ncbi:HNH endonuclease [Streptomyces hydrogenans]|uniref:HNH endonuclease n=1 Tax=Streptomyces hydrogenans TaxID=1873719 RepID=UPI0036CEC58E
MIVQGRYSSLVREVVGRSVEGLRVARRSFLPIVRSRRKLMIWESMCVMSANGGECVYFCGRPAETVDHAIPFASGGSDDFDNFLPACSRCNNEKNQRDPVHWYLASNMREDEWSDGTLTSGAPGRRGSLRTRYLMWHEEALELLQHCEEVSAEVRDFDRQMWFLNRYFDLGYPSPGLTAGFWLAWSKDSIAEAHKNGFPPAPC